MAIRSAFGTNSRTMRVGTDLLGRIALFGLVLHLGVTIGRHGQTPTVIVRPPAQTVVTETARAQPLADPTPALLPALGEDLPEIGTKAFDRRMKQMGLNAKEVAQFAQMMRLQDLTAFRK